MRIDIITLFPEMFAALDATIPGRAQKFGALELKTHMLRNFAINKHGQVDDIPYGGEAGMVLRPEPLKAAVDSVFKDLENLGNGKIRPYIVQMGAQGKIFTQERAKELAKMENLLIICGHYKGIDQRFCDSYVDEELSIGEYIVSGGELPAMIVIDAIARLRPGVLGDLASAETDSFYQRNRLGWPVYTRPQDFEGKLVPEVLTSGHHENIRKWQIKAGLELTRRNRPDLFGLLDLTDEEKKILNSESD
jgi:tRNA (guanine37-N1)-methyltransferase